MLAYRGILSPAKVKNGKVEGRTTGDFTQFLTDKSLHNNNSKLYKTPYTNLL